MLFLLLNVVISIILCAVIHESGHYIAAKIYGHAIDFRFDRSNKLFNIIPIPRGLWDMPIIEPSEPITLKL